MTARSTLSVAERPAGVGRLGGHSWHSHPLWIVLLFLAGFMDPAAAQADATTVIPRVKPSIVAIGTFQSTRNPRFQFRGTGFAVGDGRLVVTNAHVLPLVLDNEQRETLVIAVPGKGTESEVRRATVATSSREYDLAILKFDGAPLPPLRLGDASRVREGQRFLFTGFPIGSAIGLFPATHEAMVSALAPIAIPLPDTKQMDARTLRRIKEGAFSILQLDGTAYPGNSGSPLYDPETGNVIGIINMVFVKGMKEAAISAPSGISYAIPVQPLEDLLQTIR